MAELELRHLRVVCAVADAGSVSKAAARLGVSQPALSAQLTRIERVLGGLLFERGRAGITATELGEFVLHRATTLLRDMEVLVSTARERSEDGRSVLRAGSIPLLTVGAFVDQLRGLPELEDVQTFIEGSAALVFELLVTGRVDVALFERFEALSTLRHAGITVREFSVEPQFVAVAEWHPTAGNDAIDLAELARCDWVVPPPHENGQRQQLTEACEAAGFTPRVRHFTSEASTARTLVAQGAVSLATAGSKDGGGLVVRRLTGDPIMTELLFATRDSGWFAERADALFACAARAHQTTVDRNPAFRQWWDEHPEAHPAVEAAL
ncbi:MAG: LysR family transcriptional regulator [Sciscionella sp.]